MNPIIILCRNNLELTQRAIESALRQDVPCWILAIDNDSSDGTWEWLQSKRPRVISTPHSPQLGVSGGWNYGIRKIFSLGYEHVLVINNDVFLPPWFYGSLLRFGAPFITGVSVDKMDGMEAPPHEFSPPVEAPDFSAFLINSWCWKQVGAFNEQMKFYASDNEYHVRAHRKGIPLLNGSVPFYHERSSTIRLASEKELAAIKAQADSDREVFKSLYGCYPWEPAYGELLK